MNPLKENKGQGATEYILLLLIVVAIGMLARNDISQWANERFSANYYDKMIDPPSGKFISGYR